MSKKKDKKKKNKTSKPNAHDTVVGVLDLTRSGMGYVDTGNDETDIIIRPQDLYTALNGDTVKVKLKRTERGRRRQGEVIEVVKRKRTEFPGRLEIRKNFAFFIPDSDQIPDIYVPLDKINGATEEDKVVVKLTSWEKNRKPEGEVVKTLNPEDLNDIAMHEIISEAGFSSEFPDEVIEEAERLPDVLPSDEMKRRKDYRDVFTITIDPVDAKDFDDAISLRKLNDVSYEIGVHIADVSYFVEPDSEMDKEAYKRATSVYLPDRVLPMLPEKISNELCSLRPHEDKFAFSVIFKVSKTGKVMSSKIERTVINSDHRFSYEEVQEIIEQKTGLYAEEILLLNQFAQKYRAERFKNGAINFSSQEVRFKLDEKGVPIGIVIKESKEAHQLIEEFMLLANKTVAEFVSKFKVNGEPVPFSYRVHDTPDEEKLIPFIAFAQRYGYTFDTTSPKGIADSFNRMLEKAKNNPERHVLEQLGIRTMAKAVYTTENIGHYGLGFSNYCHFTSPIRRYPDIMVHRIVQQCLDNNIRPDKKMEVKNRHASERERAAMEAERAANKYKQVEYMQNFIGEEFQGVISGVTSFGFFVETIEHKCEGLVSIASLSEFDDFMLIEEEYSLVGRRSGRKFRMGDKVTIKVIAANLTKRQLDYEWVITRALRQKKELEASPSEPKKKEGKKSKSGSGKKKTGK